MRKLLLLLLGALVCLAPACAAKPYGYLYCHMSDRGEWTAFALSRDGLQWHDLNRGNEVYDTYALSRIEGGARDAFIARDGSGKGFVMVTTDMCVASSHKWDNYGIDLLTSPDLIHWKSVTFDFRKGPSIFADPHAKGFYNDYSAIHRVWAPQVIWVPSHRWSDGTRGAYFVYYSMLNSKEDKYDRLFYSWADRSFTRLTQPQLLIDWGYATIDADINYVEADKRWHMLVKKEGGHPGIFTTTSEELTGPWPKPDDTDYINFEGKKLCEGPSAFRIAGEDGWRVAYVEYSSNPHRYRICKADPMLSHFSDPEDIRGVEAPQHGSFLALNKKEYQRLENYWAQRSAETSQGCIRPGAQWLDTDGKPVNAHGGGLLSHNGQWYWFGEFKESDSNSAHVGISCYKSNDLVNWENCGIALRTSKEKGSEIEQGCIMERPKVVYNPRTRKFVMWFHLELKGHGYDAARSGVAVSDRPEGPYTFLRSDRVNAWCWPEGFSEEDKDSAWKASLSGHKAWSREWMEAVRKGAVLSRDYRTGQMARDMTLFVDDDGKAYHIYSSEDNLTLQIAELNSDFTAHTGRFCRVAPCGQNEAPALFKHDGKYWLITSGCTGWAPNKARMFSADSLFGQWKQWPSPCQGPDADITFGGQSTYVQPLPDGRYLFMADIWRPKHPIDGRYVWLPIDFTAGGTPVIKWREKWNITSTASDFVNASPQNYYGSITSK